MCVCVCVCVCVFAIVFALHWGIMAESPSSVLLEISDLLESKAKTLREVSRKKRRTKLTTAFSDEETIDTEGM